MNRSCFSLFFLFFMLFSCGPGIDLVPSGGGAVLSDWQEVTVKAPTPAAVSTGIITFTITFPAIPTESINISHVTVQTTGDVLGALTAVTAVTNKKYEVTIVVAGGNGELFIELTYQGHIISFNTAKVIVDNNIPPEVLAVTGTPARLNVDDALSIDFAEDPLGTNIDHFNIKLCENSGCSDACIENMTATASPVTITPAVSGAFYICVQTVNIVEVTSDWKASATRTVVLNP